MAMILRSVERENEMRSEDGRGGRERTRSPQHYAEVNNFFLVREILVVFGFG